jgi:hypothetical protein
MSRIINIPPIAAEITGGSVDVNATIGEDRASINTRKYGVESEIDPGDSRVLISFTVPEGKNFILYSVFGSSDCDMLATITQDGEPLNTKRNSHMQPDVDLSIKAPYLIQENEEIKVIVTNRSDFGTKSSAEFWLYGHMFTPTPT